MKLLKVSHKIAGLVLAGKKNSTWRINDEKNVSVDDEIGLVDKVNPDNPDTWQVIGTGHVNTVLQKRLSDIGPGDLGAGEDFATHEDMLKTFRNYYGRDVNEHTTVKIISFDFKPQQPILLNKLDAKNTTDLTEVKLYTDGGSRGNPGPAASGYVLMNMQDGVIFQGGQYLGITTNNQAEYNALKIGLQEAAARSSRIVHVYMDSLLVVNQMKGIYKIKNADLAPVYHDIKNSLIHFEQVTFTHVPRELNKLADAMVNEILDTSNI